MTTAKCGASRRARRLHDRRQLIATTSISRVADLYLVDNEVHHRAQGYVYLRALGIVPPSWER